MRESVRVLEPVGLMDSNGSAQVRREVADLLDVGVEALLIDFKNITFIDSSGLGTLVAILVRARSKRTNLYLCSLNDQANILLELTKMDKVFNIFPDRATFDREIENSKSLV
ncbi:STAS domain-containing protein [Tumidithrix elongata RA019]|uniref:Anti-sigma factor antagonist n=1 Tax=Tumidithrix elongata BACA0141 TaxID=2716417 RepID=A0AAW9PZT9_9CYAN|nr:STAS domain-containing protein [Tumidithrix elongata RA019]